jgi:hypothetical protein
MRKFKSTRRKQRGGLRYEDLNPEISDAEYRRLNSDDAYYYDSECIHKKVTKATGNIRKTFARARENRRRAEIARRIAEITSNEYEGTITKEEFDRLERGQQAGWKRVPTGPYPGNNSIMYQRKTPENERRERESTVEWQIEHNPRVELSENQYHRLTPAQKALGWVKLSREMGMGGYGGTETYYRRRTAENERREREERYRESLEGRIALPYGQITHAEYATLSNSEKPKWHKKEFQIERGVFINPYVKREFNP